MRLTHKHPNKLKMIQLYELIFISVINIIQTSWEESPALDQVGP